MSIDLHIKGSRLVRTAPWMPSVRCGRTPPDCYIHASDAELVYAHILGLEIMPDWDTLRVNLYSGDCRAGEVNVRIPADTDRATVLQQLAAVAALVDRYWPIIAPEGAGALLDVLPPILQPHRPNPVMFISEHLPAEVHP